MPTCVALTAAGRFNYRNPDQSYSNSAPTTGLVPGLNEPILPEKVWDIGANIYFDLYSVTRSFLPCGQTPIYASQIAFTGVKRYAPGAGLDQPHTSARPFHRKPQTYVLPLAITWAHFDAGGTIMPVRQYTQIIENYDFELYAIRVSQPSSPTALVLPDFSITLYDAHRQATSNSPVPIWYLNSARPTARTASLFLVSFPCPPLVYPVNSRILLDVQSNLCAPSLPQNYAIDFVGAWRIPS